jgi:hypothetical protein
MKQTAGPTYCANLDCKSSESTGNSVYYSQLDSFKLTNSKA